MSAPERNAPQLRLPAFGRELLDLRENGMVPKPGWCGAHVLIVLDSWEIASRRWRLVIAPGDNPAELDFLGVAGLETIIIHDARVTERGRLDAAIRAVLRSNPSSLATFNIVAPHAVEIIKSRAVGIERWEFRAHV